MLDGDNTDDDEIDDLKENALLKMVYLNLVRESTNKREKTNKMAKPYHQTLQNRCCWNWVGAPLNRYK